LLGVELCNHGVHGFWGHLQEQQVAVEECGQK
jgi:hypothetical protein